MRKERGIAIEVGVALALRVALRVTDEAQVAALRNEPSPDESLRVVSKAREELACHLQLVDRFDRLEDLNTVNARGNYYMSRYIQYLLIIYS